MVLVSAPGLLRSPCLSRSTTASSRGHFSRADFTRICVKSNSTKSGGELSRSPHEIQGKEKNSMGTLWPSASYPPSMIYQSW